MSEARDYEEHEDAATEQDEGEAVDQEDSQDQGEEDEGDEERRPAAKPIDWEKRAHSHAGQAARERSKRQAAERRNQELEDRLERLERRSGGGHQAEEDDLLAMIAQLRDDDEDPVGDIANLKRALKLYRARELGGQEADRQQQRATREVEALKETMADAEADFAIEHPDYRDAAAFYRKVRAEELTDMGYSGEALMSKLANDLFGLVRTAFSTGMDPAERVYELAKKRGFKAGQKAADKKLDALDRAGAGAQRPQGRGGVGGVLSWGDVAKLDGAARDKAWEALRRREMGRR